MEVTHLTALEIQAITGYVRPLKQLEVLHKRGFERAYRACNGSIILERPHYDAVCRGEFMRTGGTKPTVNVAFMKRGGNESSSRNT